MALTNLIPASPNTNLKAGVDMTPLKTGDYNNKIKPEIDTAIALKAPITDASLLGTIKMTDLPVYADDAAAGVGGLVAGTLYQTDGSGGGGSFAAGILMIKQ